MTVVRFKKLNQFIAFDSKVLTPNRILTFQNGSLFRSDRQKYTPNQHQQLFTINE